jgi:hypothetical protein
MIHNIILPFVFGLLLVGATTQRTVAVLHGQVLFTAVLSIFVSLVYWFSIQYVVQANIAAYISFSAGAVLVTTMLAYKEKKGKQK